MSKRTRISISAFAIMIILSEDFIVLNYPFFICVLLMAIYGKLEDASDKHE